MAQTKIVNADKKPIKKKIAQIDPKNILSEPVQLYQLEQLGSSFTKINETLEKIKIELKIDSFLCLADYLEKLLMKKILKKTLIFMEGVVKFPHD